MIYRITTDVPQALPYVAGLVWDAYQQGEKHSENWSIWGAGDYGTLFGISYGSPDLRFYINLIRRAGDEYFRVGIPVEGGLSINEVISGEVKRSEFAVIPANWIQIGRPDLIRTLNSAVDEAQRKLNEDQNAG